MLNRIVVCCALGRSRVNAKQESLLHNCRASKFIPSKSEPTFYDLPY